MLKLNKYVLRICTFLCIKSSLDKHVQIPVSLFFDGLKKKDICMHT